MKSFIICILACAQLSHGEDVTLVVTSQSNEAAFSETVTLNQGDTAKLIFAYSSDSDYHRLVCNVASKTFEVRAILEQQASNPIAIAGPATIVLKHIDTPYDNASASAFATLSITRAGIASPPASTPQEAGTSWDVILESSSDLINWTLANPGEYSGTEPKRFFRTRIVRKP